MMTVHVRWPARPAEHRAGLEFSLLLSLFQDKESKWSIASKQKVEEIIFERIKETKMTVVFLFFLLLVQKKETKKSTPPMMYGHWRTP